MNPFADMYISTVHEKAPEYILRILAIPAGGMNKMTSLSRGDGGSSALKFLRRYTVYLNCNQLRFTVVIFWLESKIRVLMMYFYSDNKSVDYEALAIPGTSGESKYM